MLEGWGAVRCKRREAQPDNGFGAPGKDDYAVMNDRDARFREPALAMEGYRLRWIGLSRNYFSCGQAGRRGNDAAACPPPAWAERTSS